MRPHNQATNVSRAPALRNDARAPVPPRPAEPVDQTRGHHHQKEADEPPPLSYQRDENENRVQHGEGGELATVLEHPRRLEHVRLRQCSAVHPEGDYASSRSAASISVAALGSNPLPTPSVRRSQFLETHPGELDALQRLLGHRKPETTQIYLRRLEKESRWNASGTSPGAPGLVPLL